MKINKIFHSLYLMVMFLPCFIIPIFAININQKSVEPISIEVHENIAVDFNQLIEYPYRVDIRGNAGEYNVTVSNEELIVTGTGYGNAFFKDFTTDDFDITHKYLITGFDLYQGFNLRIYYNAIPYTQTLDNNTIFTFAYDTACYLYINKGSSGSMNVDIRPQLIDLTQMFGAGYEPTVTDFKSVFNQTYYDYTLSKPMLVPNPTTTTYDDTDIGSQFLYSLYKPINDYFNFSNYFGLNGIYDWFQLYFFNGTAPLSFFIFFNMMIYWLLISILWLLFDVLIYVPLLIHRWLDKASVS